MGRKEAQEPRLRLLVVDDDVVVPMLLALELDAVEIVEATRYADGLAMAREGPPDAVVVDQNLPDGEGLELIRVLRTRPETADLPMVLVSAGHDEAHRGNVLRAGADDYLAKPLSPQELEAMVRDLLEVSLDEMRRRREEARARPLRASGPEAAPTD